MWGAARLAAMISLAAPLALPSGATGTITIGSDLGRAPTVANSCAPSCTLATTSLPSADQAPGGLASPVDGTVVRWRVRVGGTSSETTFRVIKHLDTSGHVTGGGISRTVTPPVNATSEYLLELPIGFGDLIGIDCCASSGSQVLANTPTAVSGLWNPKLVDGGPGRLPSAMLAYEVPVSADIEPTSSLTIGQVKSGKGGKVTVAVTPSNPGTLVGGDKRDASLASASAGKRRVLLKRSSAPVGVPRQTIRLLLKPTKLARALLAEKGKLKAKARLAFTPTGGSTTTQVIRVSLKR